MTTAITIWKQQIFHTKAKAMIGESHPLDSVCCKAIDANGTTTDIDIYEYAELARDGATQCVEVCYRLENRSEGCSLKRAQAMAKMIANRATESDFDYIIEGYKHARELELKQPTGRATLWNNAIAATKGGTID